MHPKLQQIITHLQYHFRLVLFDETTLAELSHVRLSRLKLYTYLGALLLGLMLLLFAFIVFTPLKEYVPGYGNFDNYRRALVLQRRTDSLSSVTNVQYEYIAHLRSLFADTLYMDIPAEAISPITEWADSGANTGVIPFIDTLSVAESELRHTIEQQSSGVQSFDEQAAYHSGIADLYFFAPANGTIIQEYEPDKGHFGITIAGSEAAPIKAISDGVVLMSEYSPEKGYVIAIQHAHNLVSVYKNNAALLKKAGTYIKAGEVIAQMGNINCYGTSACLYFELWYKQNSVNPVKYILF